MKLKLFILMIIPIALNSCSNERTEPKMMNAIAESYVKLVLQIGQYNGDFVDAYYGPEEWKPDPSKRDSSEEFPYTRFNTELNNLQILLSQMDTSGFDEMNKLRFIYLKKQMTAVKAKIEMINGKTFMFDEESQNLYDAVAPTHPESYFEDLLKNLDKELPGKGTVSERLNTFKNRFIIPKEKLDTVFKTAIIEARKRTENYIQLPDSESFKLEYVTNKAWSGYNWYKGKYQSVIQINTDLPIFIDRAIDLACHEGYPGHHVYNVLLEDHMVNSRGWVEFSVYPLFCPQSLIAEGSANYGIDVAFPGKERIEYEKNNLFPLAGLKSDDAEKYYHIMDLTKGLSYAGNEAARQYLEGKLSLLAAGQWLVKYALMSPERAAQRMSFIEKYRSYVINYNLGQDLVKEYVERKGGSDENTKKRWEIFTHLLSTPQVPSNLK